MKTLTDKTPLYKSILLVLLLVFITHAKITPLIPEEEAFVSLEEFFVSFSYSSSTPVKKIALYFDDLNISTAIRKTKTTISFIPQENFKKRDGILGPHVITIFLFGPFREVLEKRTLRFYITEKRNISSVDKLALIEQGENLTGVTLETIDHSGTIYSGIDYRSYQDSGVFAGILEASGYGDRGKWFYNYNISLTSKTDKNAQSPQNLRVATGYGDLFKIGIGDNWPSYNKFVLDGVRIRGVELSLKTPKKSVNLDIIGGSSLRAVDPFSTQLNDSSSTLHDGTYRRDIFATRLHFGSGKVFKLGFDFLKGREDSTSISQVVRRDTSIITVDSINNQFDTLINESFVGPKENLAVGADLSIHLFDKRIALFSNYAFSLYTDNMLIRDSIFYNYSPGNFFTINGTTKPLPLDDESPGEAFSSAMVWDAGFRLELPFKTVRETFECSYFQHGGNFTSFGNNFLSVNKAGIQLYEELRLLSGKITINSTFRFYTDDLNGLKPDPTNTSSFTLNTALFWDAKLPALSLFYNNLSSRTQDTKPHRLENKNHGVGTSISYTRAFSFATHSASFRYEFRKRSLSNAYQFLDEDSTSQDTIPIFKDSIIGDEDNSQLVSLFVNSRFSSLPLRTRLGLTGMLSKGAFTTNEVIPSIGLTWVIIPEKMLTDFDLLYRHMNDASYEPTNDLEFESSWHYQFAKQHSLYAEVGFDKRFGSEYQYVDRNVKVTYEYRY